MLSVYVPVGPAVNYNAPILKPSVSVYQIRVDFDDGNQLFMPEGYGLGTVCVFSSLALMGELTFQYSYNEKNKPFPFAAPISLWLTA